ncbi:MAG: hypothetical protein WAK94_05180 [Steroidobacteraceae bacterium]
MGIWGSGLEEFAVPPPGGIAVRMSQAADSAKDETTSARERARRRTFPWIMATTSCEVCDWNRRCAGEFTAQREFWVKFRSQEVEVLLTTD